MSGFSSCIYLGEVVHQRFSPKRHRLRYRLFQGLFNLDELPNLGRKLRFFSHNGANVFAFHDSDHGDGGSLRAYVETLVTQAGLSVCGGRIAVLCMPRVLGFVFNPLSIFYCYDRDDNLVSVIYEVNNTFGQRHSYLIPVEAPAGDGVRQRCQKVFYVSPFMDMDMNYDFKLTFPGKTLTTTIDGSHADGSPLIFASFSGVRRELSDITLLSVLVMYPLLTLGVLAAIHWEAIKLFAKGLRLRRTPSPPTAAVTIVAPSQATTVGLARTESSRHLHKMDKQSA
jgi:DUF1365 family protein